MPCSQSASLVSGFIRNNQAFKTSGKFASIIEKSRIQGEIVGCGFFAYSWKLPAHSGAFLLKVDDLAFLLTIGAFLLTVLASLLTVGAFLLTVGKCL